MPEETFCSVCGQPKKRVTVVMKLRWLDYKAKQKVVNKLISNYKICHVSRLVGY
jgi:hypothetical protein